MNNIKNSSLFISTIPCVQSLSSFVSYVQENVARRTIMALAHKAMNWISHCIDAPSFFPFSHFYRPLRFERTLQGSYAQELNLPKIKEERIKARETIEILVHQISTEKHSEYLKGFLKALPLLTAFFERESRRVASYADDVLTSEQENIKKMKSSMQDILMHVIAITGESRGFIQRLKHGLRCLDTDQSTTALYSGIASSVVYAFNSRICKVLGKEVKVEYDQLSSFFMAFFFFRHQCLTRCTQHACRRAFFDIPALPYSYSIQDHIKNIFFATGRMISRWSASSFTFDLASKVTWIHGTNSAILPCLEKTGFALIPTGQLRSKKIIPFSGELGNGITKRGINQNNLSGCMLDGYSMVISYAEYSSSKAREEKHLWRFLQKSPQAETVGDWQGFIGCGSGVRTAMAIRRLRALDPEFLVSDLGKRLRQMVQGYYKELAKLRELAQQLKTQKASECKIDAIEGSVYAIEELHRALVDDISPIDSDERKYIENPFPIVFGSVSLLPSSYNLLDYNSEAPIRGEAKLGSDIQMVFVPASRRAQTQSYFDKALGKAKVHVLSLATLQKAADIYCDLRPIFANVFGNKKMHQLA